MFNVKINAVIFYNIHVSCYYCYCTVLYCTVRKLKLFCLGQNSDELEVWFCAGGEKDRRTNGSFLQSATHS